MDPAKVDAVAASRARSPRRRLWALGGVVGIAVGAIGGIVGARSAPPVFVATAWVGISGKLEVNQFKFDDSESVRLQFERTVSSEAAAASSPRVVDMAMASPSWRRLGRPQDAAGASRFRAQVSTVRHAKPGYFAICFRDEDRLAALVGASEVQTAYVNVVAERGEPVRDELRRELEIKRSAVVQELSSLDRRLGSTPESNAAKARLARLDGYLDDVQTAASSTLVPDIHVEPYPVDAVAESGDPVTYALGGAAAGLLVGFGGTWLVIGAARRRPTGA